MKLDIITYRDLKVKDDIFILWLKSFGFNGTASWMEEYRHLEHWLGDGPIGMCGLLDGKLVGFVGIAEIPTRTKSGETEIVGGIHGIATRPGLRRQGIGRQLLDAAHEWLREQGHRLVFLTTSTSIVACEWYRKDGYEQVSAVDDYSYLYKVFDPARIAAKDRESDKQHRLDMNQPVELFEWFARNRCGFVDRTAKLLKARQGVGNFDRKLSLSVDNGYALLSSSLDCIRFCEILAKTKKAYRELIKLAEAKAGRAAVAIQPFDPKAVEVFRACGYTDDPGSFAILMVKSLDGTSFDDLYDDSFMISRIDWF